MKRAVAVLLFLAAICVYAGQAQALGPEYFHDSGAGCDVELCGDTTVELIVGESSAVNRSSVNLTAYFTSDSGQLTIFKPHWCPGQAGNTDETHSDNFYALNPMADGTAVTRYVVSSGGAFSIIRQGNKYSGTDARCNDSHVLNLTNMQYDAGLQLYYATVSVEHIDNNPGTCRRTNRVGCDGVHNYFTVRETSSNAYAIAHKGGSTGYEVTAKQKGGTDDNVTWYIKFGSDCSVPAGGRVAQMSYYDVDNGFGSIPQQNGDLVMVLKDEAGNVLDSWTPPSGENITGQRSFNFQPNTKYVWEIQNVYVNNTVQFGTPFDGIYFQRDCSPMALACEPLSISPLEPEPGTDITATGIVTSSYGPAPAGSTGTMQVSGAGAPGAVAVSATPVPQGLRIRSSPPFQVTAPGTFTVTWTATIGGQTISCSGTFTAVSRLKPFFEVNGGDVMAGAGFAAGGATASDPAAPCAASDPSAGVVGWNRHAAPDYTGAGGEYATFAVSYIQDFATNQGNNPSPTSLSFSNVNETTGTINSINTGTGMFGGMFGGMNACVDYWGTKPNWDDMTPFPNSGNNFNGVPNDVYKHDGDLMLGFDEISPGQQITVYVNGNVRLTADGSGRGIVYQANNWLTVTGIPAIRIIALGSIHIDSSVRQLDGFYVAVPKVGYVGQTNTFASPLPGTISTCSSGFNVYDPAAAGINGMLSACASQLVVNGGLAANQIWLLRTLGTSNMSGVPAEVINYGPEVWMSAGANATFDTNYKSVVGLPPKL